MIANNIVVYDYDAKLSEHFKAHEFCTDGRGQQLTYIDPKLLWILELIRNQIGLPIYIEAGNGGATKMHKCGMCATISSEIDRGTLYSIASDFVPRGHVAMDGDFVQIDSNF